MKHKKLIVQFLAGLALALLIAVMRGASGSPGMTGWILAACDGFTVTAILYLCTGALRFTSSSGIFDIFGYAFRQGAHGLLPGRIQSMGSFYDYKMKKVENREKQGSIDKSPLWIGLLFLLIGIALTVLWYAAAE